MDDESEDRAGVRSGHPAEGQFAETGDLVLELIVDLLVEGDEGVGKPLRFSHDPCLLQTVTPVNIIMAPRRGSAWPGKRAWECGEEVEENQVVADPEGVATSRPSATAFGPTG